MSAIENGANPNDCFNYFDISTRKTTCSKQVEQYNHRILYFEKESSKSKCLPVIAKVTMNECIGYVHIFSLFSNFNNLLYREITLAMIAIIILLPVLTIIYLYIKEKKCHCCVSAMSASKITILILMALFNTCRCHISFNYF